MQLAQKYLETAYSVSGEFVTSIYDAHIKNLEGSKSAPIVASVLTLATVQGTKPLEAVTESFIDMVENSEDTVDFNESEESAEETSSESDTDYEGFPSEESVVFETATGNVEMSTI